MASPGNFSHLSYAELINYLESRPNVSLSDILRPDMTFSDTSLMSVIIYGLLFVVAACGNLAVFCTLFRNRHKSTRVSLFIMHLSLADLIVTFIVMPLEISWHLTVSWNAGDLLCRVFMFFRAFGFYLSSFILVAISVDRYLVFTRPLALTKADRRGRGMLIGAWMLSSVASLPQSVIFHTESNPEFPWFEQCLTFNFFPSGSHELAYNMFNFLAVYACPLLAIVCTYSLILCQMTRTTTKHNLDVITLTSNGKIRRKIATSRTQTGIEMERARTRTLKMTIVIVSAFVVCWTPYFVMSTWWWFDRKSADSIHPMVQKGLFLFAVSNSCMNPIVYGMFSTVFKRAMRKRFHRFFWNFRCTQRRGKSYRPKR